MYLIHTKTLSLVSFGEKNTPHYAILSHTWGDEEVTFQDIYGRHRRDHPLHKKGYSKIRDTCTTAKENGIEYAWVDTCCIDKTSSTELSESINSMFRWYQNAKVCYAFLSDVTPSPKPEALAKSRWFYRGWTLQELLAPTELEFYASDWSFISTRRELAPTISEITGIAAPYLYRRDSDSDSDSGIHLLRAASVAERMSWAAKRKTTRTEDIAYCLLGIFDISMPLLYGEGTKAFLRLQEEIIKRWDDHSLFAWHYRTLRDIKTYSGGALGWDKPVAEPGGVLASSPANFANCGHVVPCRMSNASGTFSTTNKGLHITLPMYADHALLGCRRKNDLTTIIVLRLERLYDNVYTRALMQPTGLVNYRAWWQWRRESIIIATRAEEKQSRDRHECHLMVRSMPEGFEMVTVAESMMEENESHTRYAFPLSSMVCGEAKTFERALTSPETDTIVLKLTVRKLYIGKSDYRWIWVSYQFLPQEASVIGAASYGRGRFRSLMGRSRFWALPSGDILYAELNKQDIFYDALLTVDLRRAPSWSPKVFLLRITWLLSDGAREPLVYLAGLMPQWLSPIFWNFHSHLRLKHQMAPVIGLSLFFQAATKAVPFPLGEPSTRHKTWVSAFFQRFLNGGRTQISSSAVILALLASLPALYRLGIGERWITETRGSFYTCVLLEGLPLLYKFFIRDAQSMGTKSLAIMLLPPLLQSLLVLYRALRLLRVARPQYVVPQRRHEYHSHKIGGKVAIDVHGGGVDHPLSVSSSTVIADVISPWVSTWMISKLVSIVLWAFKLTNLCFLVTLVSAIFGYALITDWENGASGQI